MRRSAFATLGAVLLSASAFASLGAQSTVAPAVRAALQAAAGHYPLVSVTIVGHDSAMLVFEDSSYTDKGRRNGTWMFGPPATVAEADGCPPEKVLGRRIGRVFWQNGGKEAGLKVVDVRVRGATPTQRLSWTDMYYTPSQLEGKWVGDPDVSEQFRLPFDGRWFVYQGGDSPNVNEHASVRAQAYGLDFVKVSGPDQRELSRPAPKRVEDFYSWDAPVLAPADGEVVSLADTLPDDPLGMKDADHPLGNHVVLRVAPERFVFLAHMRRGTVAVKVGDHLKRGDLLGRCGNSGNSDFPHVHMHVQDSLEFNTGTGQNVQFTGINVELSGKQFERVDWPLIRGLFVWNP